MTTSTSTSLISIVAAPPSGRAKAVVLDHHDYASSVILRGRAVPWDNAVEYCAYFSQAQGLLRPDTALLDLSRLYDHLATGNTRLEAAMAGRSRTGYALRTLLADEGTTKSVQEFATVFAQTARQPVVLRIPSPMNWLLATHAFGGAADVAELSADDAENASMYVSDWLRSFTKLPIAGVLLDDRCHKDGGTHVSVPLETYSPIANVTGNYRWTLGQLDGRQVKLHAETAEGGYIPDTFWHGAQIALPDTDFFYAEVPVSARPEDVLARLESFK